MDESFYNWSGSRLFEDQHKTTKPKQTPEKKVNVQEVKPKVFEEKPKVYNEPKVEIPQFIEEKAPVVATQEPKEVVYKQDDEDLPGPPPVMNREYIAGYLSTLIGQRIRAEFVVGTNNYMDKTGILREVGVNYFVLEDYISRALTMCDLYSVRFVTALPM